ncbi:hypothetical protein F981_02257 [Acinetobacter guillouiae CIP 63.46]|jgi:hypothetical protein|nr:hypothetical protein F981_02257 [Acinetobacter guillouiae CIP 63.46]KAB0627065.1 hypothetical protein F7P82_10410 [Acinetobacter guillouiae]
MTNPYINSKFYILILVLFISIMTTNVIHNDLSDTLLTIINCFIIIKILHVLSIQLLNTIFKICNP